MKAKTCLAGSVTSGRAESAMGATFLKTHAETGGQELATGI